MEESVSKDGKELFFAKGKNNVVFCENFVKESAVAARQHRQEQ